MIRTPRIDQLFLVGFIIKVVHQAYGHPEKFFLVHTRPKHGLSWISESRGHPTDNQSAVAEPLLVAIAVVRVRLPHADRGSTAMVTRTIIWASLAARLADSGAYPDGCWHRRHSGSDDLELVRCSCPLHCLSPFEFARCQVCGCHSYSGREVVSRRRWWLRRPQAGRLV